MAAGILLTIAVAAIVVLLVLVIKVKMSAFVALLLVSFGTAVATGIALPDIVPTMTAGMGNTLSSVMIVVGLGAMLGRLIEVSGGADALATKFSALLGPKRIVAAVTAAAFVLGIPVFFDVGFIILAPIVFGFARVAKLNPLKLGLPVAGAMLTVHVALPPHPGPVAAAGITGTDVGMMLLWGLPIAAVTAVVGFFAAKLIKIDTFKLLDSPATKQASLVGEGEPGRPALGAGSVVFLILLPILQIMLGTVGNMVLEEGTPMRGLLGMLGASPVALLTAVIVGYLVVGHNQGWSLDRRGAVLDSALPDVAVIVFVTGAGGVFANVLVTSGIGAAFSEALISIHMPIILAGFLISAALRASQGSATVAILTAAGLLAQPIIDAGYNSTQMTLVTLAIAFGGLGLSHINDSGFWIVTKYLGLSVKDGLRSWTVLSTVYGVTGFLLTWGVFALVS
ncbi:gluconate:H+ symporter, GntP family [Tessaracoccus bendigoensis DSM 12906]|uniref:Gluconate:H+ symporter, GntP family n=1 Tax=Tessaracoccus bendigoensis DSM 12906 TaxID=1123357 RepID=A0A1M6F268_9ACTN|nr:GntP family transporter [Tessaracoccus bendigoensis]SHI91797.1 gluconate:H+ symporter, GntP family [Tessaracoccus bendigoensis DSM 12906]